MRGRRCTGQCRAQQRHGAGNELWGLVAVVARRRHAPLRVRRRARHEPLALHADHAAGRLRQRPQCGARARRAGGDPGRAGRPRQHRRTIRHRHHAPAGRHLPDAGGALEPGPPPHAAQPAHAVRRALHLFAAQSLRWPHAPAAGPAGGVRLGFAGHAHATAIELGCADSANACQLPTGLQADPFLRQVVTRTLEFGGRWQPADATEVTLALYRSDNRDDIVFQRSPVSPLGYFSNFPRRATRAWSWACASAWAA